MAICEIYMFEFSVNKDMKNLRNLKNMKKENCSIFYSIMSIINCQGIVNSIEEGRVITTLNIFKH